MMSARHIATILMLIPSTALAQSWTESFVTGVGRLDQTTGNGDTVFVHDADEQAIDGTFIRYLRATPSNDSRYAQIDPIMWDHSVVRFSFVMTPQFGTEGSPMAAKVGFIDTSDWNVAIVRFRHPNQDIALQLGGRGTGGGEVGIPFTWGDTYFVDAVIDGPNRLFRIDAYLGSDSSGNWIGDYELDLTGVPSITFDAFGLMNNGSGSEQSEVHATIHEISLAGVKTVPAASAWGVSVMSLLLLLAGTIVLRRQHAARFS